jgi:hypothetical protein
MTNKDILKELNGMKEQAEISSNSAYDDEDRELEMYYDGIADGILMAINLLETQQSICGVTNE